MQLRKNTDQFDDFRRERQRVRAKRGNQHSIPGYENSALRELEQQEAAEVRDQQLTREVHDFFAAATRQAAAIVEKVSHDAQAEACERMEGEVEGFLIDTLSRMNSFVMTIMQQRPNANVAETHVEPDVKHLVGSELDEFRYEGSPDARDAHIGQDPFATPIEDVQREFRAVVAEMAGGDEVAESIDGHLVADVCDYYNRITPDEDHAEIPAEHDAMQIELPAEEVIEAPVVEASVIQESVLGSPVEDDVATPEQAVEPEQSASEHGSDNTLSELHDDEPTPTTEDELETFKSALKALVRQGVLHREEALAAWNARLQAVGRAV